MMASDLTLSATWSRCQAMSRFPNTDLTMLRCIKLDGESGI